MYRINLQIAGVTLVPSAFVASRQPGYLVCVNDDGSALCIEPNGSERPGGVPAGDPNWDSPYTQGMPCGDILTYRSAYSGGPGKPVGYRMVNRS